MAFRPSLAALRPALPALGVSAALAILAPPEASAQCTAERPALLNFTGAGRVTCPCFARGEQAGAVFQAPAVHYPIEVLRVGIGWGSQFGGTPSSLEQAIHVYAGGLPDPGSPIATLEGPVLNDGAINQFNLEPLPGAILVPSGPFSVSLEFANANAGNPFAPSVVHDGTGCDPGRNLVHDGAWHDACALGVSGDWVFFAVYRSCNLAGVGGEPRVVSTAPLHVLPPRPNPTRGAVELELVLASDGHLDLAVTDVAGRRVATPFTGRLAAGVHRLVWDGRTREGSRARPGVYAVEARSGGGHARRAVVVVE